MHKTTAIIISALFILQGCASSPTEERKSSNVTSNPSGAVVYVNGLEIGKTPLQRNLFDDFPAGWKGSVYQAQGLLMMKMEGCKDYALQVNDFILRNPIHAELECSEASIPEKSTPAAATQIKAISKTESATEKRLNELENLYKKGIISKDEYQKNRERILSEL